MQQYGNNQLQPNKGLITEMTKYVVNDEKLISDHPEKRIFIVYDAQRLCLRVLTRTSSDMEHITSAFREVDESTFYVQRYSRSNLENYKYSVSPFGYFQPGLLMPLLDFIKDNRYINPTGAPVGTFVCVSPGVMQYMKEWLVPLADKLKPLIQDLGGVDEFEVPNISVDRQDSPMLMRDYQEEAIKKVLFKGFGRGLIESATGSGKSFIIANLLYSLQSLNLPHKGARALIYVPNIQLVEQFYSDLISYGYKDEELCRASGALNAAGRKRFKAAATTAPIVISNSAWCNNHIEELGKIDILVIDEAHRCSAGSKGFDNIRNQLFKCKVRVGFTGTLPQGYNFWELEGLIGPVLYRASVTNLQDMGYLAGLHIVKVKIDDTVASKDTDLLFNPHSKWKLDDYNPDTGEIIGVNDAWIAEQDWYTLNCERIFTPVLSNLLLEDPNLGNNNTLVLFDRIALGEKLFGFLEVMVAEKNLGDKAKILYVDGSVDVDVRENVRNDLEHTTGNILLGQSAILSTGINIKNLHRIVLLAGGKAQAKIVQAIGRTLRLNAGKTNSELIDVEMNYKYSKRHASERKALYKQWYNKKDFDETYNFTV